MKQWLLEGKGQCTSCLRSVNKKNTSDTACNQPRIMQDRYLPEVMKRTVADKDPSSGNMQPESRGNDVLISTIDPVSDEDKQCSSCAKFCSKQWRPHHDGKRRCKACLQAGQTSRKFSSEVIDYFTKCVAPSPKKMQQKLGEDCANSIFGTPCKPCSVIKVLPPKVKIEKSTNITTKKRDSSVNPSRERGSVHVQLEEEPLKRRTTLDTCAVASSIAAEPVKIKLEEDQWTAESSLENMSTSPQATEATVEQDKCQVQSTALSCTALLLPPNPAKMADISYRSLADSLSEDATLDSLSWSQSSPVKLDDDTSSVVITSNAISSSLEVVSRRVYDDYGSYKGHRSNFVEGVIDAVSVDFPCKAERPKRAVISTSAHTCKKVDKPDDMVRFHPSHAQQKNQRVLSVLSVLSQPNSSLENKPSGDLRIPKRSSKTIKWAQQDILRKKRKDRLDCSASTSSPPKKRSKLKIVSNSRPSKVSKNTSEIRSAAEISVMQFVIPRKTRTMDPGTTKRVDHQVTAKAVKSLKVLAGVSSNEPTPVNPTKNRSTSDKDSFKEAQGNVSKPSKNKVSLPSSSSRMPTAASSKYSDSSGIIQTTLSSMSSSQPQENGAAPSVKTFTGVENNGEGHFFVVEKIIDDRQAGKQRKEYLIKWKGYPAKYNIWEHEHNILNPILVRRYDCRKTLKILKKRPNATDATTNISRCVNALNFGDFEMDIDPTAPFDASKRTCSFCLETFDSHNKYLAHVGKHRHDDDYELLKDVAKLAPKKWYTSGVWI
uniref:Chromo domain-containing protein n=1 Tax=Chaetoceros debilis TaxID=122233 RepID=A0A7S3Q113_9STRA